jgi:hypothetical protein
MLEHYFNPHSDDDCSCGRGKRLVVCHDCFIYSPACGPCFVDRHLTQPFHWALIWQQDLGHFIKTDFSAVLPNETPIQLGNHAPADYCQFAKTNAHCNIAHINGIHATKIRFCDCPKADNKVTQLMRARLFPGTTTDPKSAFTFAVLKHFSMHNLQSKCGAYDYIYSLRRLTNNLFPEATTPVGTLLSIPATLSDLH